MWFLSLPITLVAIGAIITGAIVGLLYLVGIFGKTKGTQRKEAEEANQYVITSLQQQISELDKRIIKQQILIEDNARELDKLKKENNSLQQLVAAALRTYFEQNPNVAVKMSQILP